MCSLGCCGTCLGVHHIGMDPQCTSLSSIALTYTVNHCRVQHCRVNSVAAKCALSWHTSPHVLQVPVHTVTLDMRDLGAVAQLPQQLPEEFRDIDILINNAGLALGVATIGGHDIEVC